MLSVTEKTEVRSRRLELTDNFVATKVGAKRKSRVFAPIVVVDPITCEENP